MLTKDDIKKFENTFLTIGNEVAFRKLNNQKVESIFENAQAQLPNEDIKIASSSEEIVDPKEKEQQVKNVLENIFNDVLDEEGVTINDLQPDPDTTQDDGANTTDSTDDTITTDTVDDTIAADTMDDTTFDIPEQATTNINAIDEEAYQEEDTNEDIARETDDFNINDLIGDDDDDDDGGFSLPTAYLKNDDDMPGDDDIDEQDIEFDDDDFNIKDIEDILERTDDLIETDEEGNISQNQEFLFRSEEALEKSGEKYRSNRTFSEDDEILFFNKIDQYNIYLSQSIIQVLDNDDLADESERLVDLVLDGAKPQIIQYEIERILKQEVNLFQDNAIYDSGDLREKLITFSSQVKKTANIVITRLVPISCITIIALFYLYSFVYRPLRATMLYEKGYDSLVESNLEESEEYFNRATNFWVIEKYFFKYADVYSDKRLYANAYKKYQQLIFGMNEEMNELLEALFLDNNLFIPITINGKSHVPALLINYNKTAFLKIIDFEIYKQADYDTARLFLDLWLELFGSNNEDTLTHSANKDILISFANMYLVMYDSRKKPEYLEQARFYFDKLSIITGNSDESLLLRARWAIRANDEQYLNDVIEGILGAADGIEINNNLLVPYLEIIKYRLKNNNYKYTADILDILKEQYPNHIDIPYLYALYYSLVSDYQLSKMLLTSVRRFEEEDTLTISEKSDYIDARIRLAEVYLYQDNNIIAAKDSITKAQLLFEKSIDDNLDPSLYRLYFIASQIELLKGNIESASSYLSESYNQGYQSADMEYHTGLLSFLKKDWSSASKTFSQIITENNIDLLNNKGYQKVLYLAVGNSLLMQKNYVASIMYYNKLLEILNEEVRRPETILTIDLSQDLNIISIQTKKMQIENNIGVALYYLSKQNPEINKNESLLYLQKSSAVYQNLSRIDNEYTRKTNIGVPQANLTTSLLPSQEQLTIYSEISYYLNNENYWTTSQKNPKTLTVN